MAVATGGRLVGVRCDDATLLGILERWLAPVRVDATDAAANFSLRSAPPPGARTPPHRLQEGCRSLVRSASLPRAVTALHAFLSAYATAGRVQVDALALVRGDAAVLVPDTLRPRLGGAEGDLRRRGLAVADAVPAVALDGRTVLLDAPALPVDAGALVGLARLAPAPAAPPPVAPAGRYALAGWAWPPAGEERRVSPAAVVAAASRAVRGRAGVEAERALAARAAAVTGTRVATLPVGPVATDAVLDAVEALW